MNTPSIFLDGRVVLLVGDITEQAVDAIVNAANSNLLGGGGVDGAIHQRGGPAILDACRSLRAEQFPDGLPTGEAVITPGGKLPARYVIHTVGPIYGRAAGGEASLLAACYQNSIQLAAKHGLTSIAFPAISTGVYGYPPALAATVASRALAATLQVQSSIQQVRLVFFDPLQMETFLTHQQFDA